jgi:hypothetical protein
MGQDWRPNKAIPVELLLLLLKAADLKIQEAVSLQKTINELSSTPMWSCAT